MSERLADPVVALCDDALGSLSDGPLRDRLEHIRDRLQAPLSVAVAGRVKAGKSTLVNALVRELIAPTGVGEVTKVVAWYRYGFPERVSVEPRVGEPWVLPLGERFALPDDLGAPADAIARVVVSLSSDVLRTMSVIDTPGLVSASATGAAATRELLAIDAASRRGVGDADAVIFLIDQGATRDDVETLAAIQRTGSGVRASALNVAGVISKVDLLGPWDAVADRAADLARRQSEMLSAAVSAVIPVVGLLAETVETGHFTERDGQAIRELADLGEEALERLFLSADRFTSRDAPVSGGDRQRLIERLGLYGLRVATRAAADTRASGADLATALRAASGIERLRDTVSSTFGRFSDALKADRAMLALERMSYEVESQDRDLAHRIRAGLESLRLDRGMQVLGELHALQECADPTAGIPDDLAGEVRRVIGATTDAGRVGLPSGAGPNEIRTAASAQVTRWRAFVNGGSATPAAVRVAEILRDSYESVWARAEAPG